MCKCFLGLAAGCLALALVVAAGSHVQATTPGTNREALQNAPAPTTAQPSPRALIDKYCVACHNQRTKASGLALDGLDLAHVAEEAETWEAVIRKLRGGVMPPAGRPRPDRATYDGLRIWLENELDRAAAANPNPGRPATFHRLNRVEYRNAIRDLLALDVEIDSWLPVDPASYGFDNIGDALGVSPTLLERYLSVAERVSAMAVGNRDMGASLATYVVASEVTQRDQLEGLPFGTRGGALIEHYFPLDGEYAFQLRLARNFNTNINALTEPHQLEVSVDGERVQLFTIGGKGRRRGTPPPDDGLYLASKEDDALRFRVPVKAGKRAVAVTFLKRPSVQFEDQAMPLLRDYPGTSDQQQPALSKVEIDGPYNATVGETASRQRVFTCRPTAAADDARCAKTILSTLARRAYRRPVTEADVRLLLQFYDEARTDGDFERGIEAALTRMLVSPSFLFRIEQDPSNAAPGSTYRVADLDLASRLSFFLWSSIPDDELLRLAEAGKLRDAKVLGQQVSRMLADSRSAALARNFTGQWLDLRKVRDVKPTQRLFPDFDANLRDAFERETELLVDSIMRQNGSVIDLLGANYTFVNERLARHYGIPDVYGPHFRRVTLDDPTRGGLLGHGSILTLTSNDTRTSPVRRGVFILENLLGIEPPAPPANVPPLPEDPARAGKVLSMRERMVEHRANPACSGCHAMMDPLGLALEHFDAVGKAVQSRTPLDLSGVLPDGTSFDGPAGLRNILMSRSNEFVLNMTEKLFTYALGRGAEPYDAPAIRKIARDAAAQNYRFSSLVLGIVTSDAFLMRRTLDGAATTVADRGR
jgi:mono/diheme cytochrome c family protein